MTDTYYKSISLADIYAKPEKYSWNCLLYYRQFTQSQLLDFKQYLEMSYLVKYQAAATREFLTIHFKAEIDDCWEVSWEDVEKYTLNRDERGGSSSGVTGADSC